MLGKIFKYVLVILLGMILGIGATVGAVYLIVTKTKVKTITDTVPSLSQYIGESLGDYTLLEVVGVLGSADTTVGTYTEYFPFLDDALTNFASSEDLKAFATVDLEALKGMTFSQVGGNLSSVLSITASLNSLSSSLSFQLPDMPVFQSAETYVKITDDNFAVTNAYYKDKTAEIYYDVSYAAPVVPEEPETPQPAAEEAPEEPQPVYDRAYDDGGNLLPEAADKPLYFRAEGIVGLPVTDAITALSGVFSDVNGMTIADLKTNFGVDIIGGDETGLIAKLIFPTDELGDLGEVATRIDTLHLVEDLGFSNIENTVLGKILDEDHRTVGALKAMDFDEEINALHLVNDLGFTNIEGTLLGKILPNEQDRTVGALKAMDFDAKINALHLVNDLGFTNIEGTLLGKILPNEQDRTVGALKNIDFDEKINALKISDVMSAEQISGNKILKWLADKNAKINEIGTKINEMPLKVIVQEDSNPITDALIKNDAKIADLSEKISALTISDVYDTDAFAKIGTGEGEAAYDENLRCFKLENGAYTETAYVAGAKLYQVKKSAGIWLITLYNKTENGGVCTYTRVTEKPPLTNLASYLIERLTGETTGLGTCTLQELYEVGFVSAEVNDSVKDYSLNDVISQFGKLPSV